MKKTAKSTLTRPEKEAIMRELQTRIALLLIEAENECASVGLTTMTSLTLVVRDPANDDMSLVVSNETPEEMRKSFRIAEGL